MICVDRKGYRVSPFCNHAKKKKRYRYDMYSVFFISRHATEYLIFSMSNAENSRDMSNLVE